MFLQADGREGGVGAGVEVGFYAGGGEEAVESVGSRICRGHVVIVDLLIGGRVASLEVLEALDLGAGLKGSAFAVVGAWGLRLIQIIVDI